MATKHTKLGSICLALGCLPLMKVRLTAIGGSPKIDFQPKEQTVILSQQAAFGVIASGTAPLWYQWIQDGVPIPGATNDQIVIQRAQFADEGPVAGRRA